ncbi:hypothetical protein HN51_001382 [Arachis hypogaea]
MSFSHIQFESIQQWPPWLHLPPETRRCPPRAPFPTPSLHTPPAILLPSLPFVPTRFSSSFGHHRRFSSTSMPPCPTSSFVRFSPEQPPSSPGQHSTAIKRVMRYTAIQFRVLHKLKTLASGSSKSEDHSSLSPYLSYVSGGISWMCSYNRHTSEMRAVSSMLLVLLILCSSGFGGIAFGLLNFSSNSRAGSSSSPNNEVVSYGNGKGA